MARRWDRLSNPKLRDKKSRSTLRLPNLLVELGSEDLLDSFYG